jgi:hypothetical protein
METSKVCVLAATIRINAFRSGCAGIFGRYRKQPTVRKCVIEECENPASAEMWKFFFVRLEGFSFFENAL